MLYLNLISGWNPKYLIEEQVKGALKIKSFGINTIPTAYILLDSGNTTSVIDVSNTKPILMENKESVLLDYTNDSLFIFWKKDSNTGSQDVYWHMNISGEYS